MRSPALFASLALALSLAFGCSSPAVTQLVVVVDTDLAIPSEIDHLTISVTGPSNMAMTRDTELAAGASLPLTLTVVPSGEVLGPVEIVASATRGTSITAVVSRRATVTLVRGESLVLLLHLARSCVGVTCGTDETCTEEGCAPVDETPLYPWTGAPPRLGADAGPAIDGGHDAGPFDAGPRDAAFDAPIRIDSGPDCSVLGCDDDNPCTDDVCDTTTRACTHDALDVACDDGAFCNGFDHCGTDGECSVHDGDPCTTETTCSEERNGCEGCTTDAMCPEAMMAEWGECTGFTDGCGNGGTHARIVRTYSCVGDLCTGSDRAEAGTCSVDRTGASCMPTVCSDFGGCGEGSGGPCGTTGSASRSCTDYTCTGGTCTSASRTDTTSCARTTEGLACGAESCGGWSGCVNDGSCSTSGTHERDCTTPTCGGGTCNDASTHQSEGCFAATDGASCGAGSCDGWSECTFADTCTTSGTQTRTCTMPVCSGGGCASGAYTQMQACPRGSTDGAPCPGATSCGAWACTGALGEYECDQDGVEQRTCRDPVCVGGACSLGAPRIENGGACVQSLDGTNCFGDSCFVCYSGSCNYICGGFP